MNRKPNINSKLISGGLPTAPTDYSTIVSELNRLRKMPADIETSPLIEEVHDEDVENFKQMKEHEKVQSQINHEGPEGPEGPEGVHLPGDPEETNNNEFDNINKLHNTEQDNTPTLSKNGKYNTYPGVTGLVLVMIVKNESKIIERCLDSTLPAISGVCITDTHSEDNTVQKIKDWCLKHNLPCQVSVSDFRNFGYARTWSFINGKKHFPNAKYYLTIDADMELVVKPSFNLDNLEAAGYKIYQETSSSRYQNIRLMKSNKGWKCSGVTHEYWDLPNEDLPLLHDLDINDRDDGGAKADKYIRDKKLLSSGLTDHSTSEHLKVRYYFYLAQTCKCLGEWETSIEWYQKRFDAGGWIEERWYSLFQIGNNHMEMSRKYYNILTEVRNELERMNQEIESADTKKKRADAKKKVKACQKKIPELEINIKERESEALDSWWRAWDFHPKRIESLHKIAEYYRQKQNNRISVEVCLIAKRQGYPLDDSLFIEKDVYEWKIDLELSIAGFYVDKNLGCQSHRYLKEISGKLPNWVKSIVDGNDKHYKY